MMISRMLFLFFLFSLLITITTVAADTTCTTTGWWAFQPFPKSVLQKFLSTHGEQLTFNTSNPLATFMKPDEHPVYFEFNQQNHCRVSSLPPPLDKLMEQTFVEFKLEIPYLIRHNTNVILKPLIYETKLLDVIGSKAEYGLPAITAKDMHADFEHNTYSISYKGGSLRASFEPLTSMMMPLGSLGTANFSSFVDVNYSPWLAFPPAAFHTQCASNRFNFTQVARVRPVKMTLHLVDNIIEGLPPGMYTNAGDQPVGAWQIDVPLRITPPYECP